MLEKVNYKLMIQYSPKVSRKRGLNHFEELTLV